METPAMWNDLRTCNTIVAAGTSSRRNDGHDPAFFDYMNSTKDISLQAALQQFKTWQEDFGGNVVAKLREAEERNCRTEEQLRLLKEQMLQPRRPPEDDERRLLALSDSIRSTSQRLDAIELATATATDPRFDCVTNDLADAQRRLQGLEDSHFRNAHLAAISASLAQCSDRLGAIEEANKSLASTYDTNPVAVQVTGIDSRLLRLENDYTLIDRISGLDDRIGTQISTVNDCLLRLGLLEEWRDRAEACEAVTTKRLDVLEPQLADTRVDGRVAVELAEQCHDRLGPIDRDGRLVRVLEYAETFEERLDERLRPQQQGIEALASSLRVQEATTSKLDKHMDNIDHRLRDVGRSVVIAGELVAAHSKLPQAIPPEHSSVVDSMQRILERLTTTALSSEEMNRVAHLAIMLQQILLTKRTQLFDRPSAGPALQLSTPSVEPTQSARGVSIAKTKEAETEEGHAEPQTDGAGKLVSPASGLAAASEEDVPRSRSSSMSDNDDAAAGVQTDDENYRKRKHDTEHVPTHTPRRQSARENQGVSNRPADMVAWSEIRRSKRKRKL